MIVFQTIGTGLVAVVAVLATAFVFRYWHRPWRTTHEGRHLMGLTVMIAVFTGLATEVRVFGPYPGAAIVAVVLYSLMVTLMWRQHLLLNRADEDTLSDAHDVPEEN